MGKKRLELSADSKVGQILKYEESRRLFKKYLPEISKRVQGQESLSGFTLRRLVEYAGDTAAGQSLELLNQELSLLEIYTENEGGGYTEDYPLTAAAQERVQEGHRSAIYPGKVWRDTEGKRIQAHGGALYYEDGIYYWYGENKDRTDGKSPVWTWGIRFYSSRDLYNWEDLGVLIRPELENPASALYPERHLDRPHILKCDATGKYVCWVKDGSDNGGFLVLVADRFTGPYTVVGEKLRPTGGVAGDFDIIKSDNGKAYLFMTDTKIGIVGFELTQDYLSADHEVSRQYGNLYAPFCREGVALFERGGKKYMFTSGMTGYVPNKSDTAVSDSWTDKFVSIGSPHWRDESNASFNSQISQVFKVPGREDLYISVADRWVPDYPVDARRADILERSTAAHFEPENYQVTEEEKQELMNSPMMDSADTSKADYVWLPLRFVEPCEEYQEGMVFIDWKDEWRIEY